MFPVKYVPGEGSGQFVIFENINNNDNNSDDDNVSSRLEHSSIRPS